MRDRCAYCLRGNKDSWSRSVRLHDCDDHAGEQQCCHGCACSADHAAHVSGMTFPRPTAPSLARYMSLRRYSTTVQPCQRRTTFNLLHPSAQRMTYIWIPGDGADNNASLALAGRRTPGPHPIGVCGQHWRYAMPYVCSCVHVPALRGSTACALDVASISERFRLHRHCADRSPGPHARC